LEVEKANLTEEICKNEVRLDEIQREKDGLLLKQEASNNMKSAAQLKKFYSEELRKLQVQRSTVSQDIDDAKKDEKSLTLQVSQLSKELSQTVQQLNQVQQDTRDALN
jgi:predicted  nucleic acid-binding Zn-ribbon protein